MKAAVTIAVSAALAATPAFAGGDPGYPPYYGETPPVLRSIQRPRRPSSRLVLA
jgi:hypothetical protein